MLTQQPRTMNKREKILAKLEQKFQLSSLRQSIYLGQEFKNLLKFCSKHIDYKFSKEVQRQIQQNLIQITFNKFNIAPSYQSTNEKKRLLHRIIYKLIQLLESNRVFPKLLGHIKLKGDIIKLSYHQESLIDEMELILENEDYLLPIKDNKQMAGNYKIDQAYLILWALEKMSPYLKQYISPKYLNYADVIQIKATYFQLQLKKGLSMQFRRIYEIYVDIIHKISDINEQEWKLSENYEQFQVCLLRTFLKKKIGKILLINLFQNQVAIPQFLRNINLIQLCDDNKFVQESQVEIKLTNDFVKYLGNFQENKNIYEILDYNLFQKIQTWKTLKAYYYDVILENFSQFENITEEETILLTLKEIYKQRNLQTKELSSQLKFKPVAKLIQEFIAKINYGVQKLDELTKNQKWIILIGKKLMEIQEQVQIMLGEEKNPQEDKQIPQSKLRVKKRADKIQAALEGDNQYVDLVRTPSLLLKNQRAKFGYIQKYYVVWLIQQGIPDPFVLSLITYSAGQLRANLNYFFLEALVKNQHFIRFSYEVFHIDISTGKAPDRIQQFAMMNQQSCFIEEYFYRKWIKLFYEQAKLIYESRESSSTQIEKHLKNHKFFQLIEDIWTEGESCQKRKALKEVLVQIQKFIIQNTEVYQQK